MVAENLQKICHKCTSWPRYGRDAASAERSLFFLLDPEPFWFHYSWSPMHYCGEIVVYSQEEIMSDVFQPLDLSSYWNSGAGNVEMLWPAHDGKPERNALRKVLGELVAEYRKGVRQNVKGG